MPPLLAAIGTLGLGGYVFVFLEDRTMSIRWDALLARHTASELDRLLAGTKLRALRLDGASRDLALLLADRTLLWRLHPRRGYLVVRGELQPVETDVKLRCTVLGVDAPPDERILRFALSAPAGRRRTLVVELMGNQWNAIVTEGTAGVIRHVLWRRAGKRGHHVGETYRPPAPPGRAGIRGDVTRETWLETLNALSPRERPAALVRTFAWTSPINAEAFLGAEAVHGVDSLAVGYERWRRMVTEDNPPHPVVIELVTGPQPYPFPLAGTPGHSAESLLQAFESCGMADSEFRGTAATMLGPVLMARLERAARRAARRVRRLEAELEGLEDPQALRALGDLILARYGEIPAGASKMRLTGFRGEEVDVELDPSVPLHENATRLYKNAAKAERAAERLPGILEDARAERVRLDRTLASARAGAVVEGEVRALLGPMEHTDLGAATGPALPYRRFRSSGGLEIRVGRGARHNDDLTFHHSAPGDVWLHARHGAGAHVILRWDLQGRPPARDLQEAATLAALHSKARTSASVPVDWTLRKYVRKPRKAPPGRVVADRVETLFVEPDRALAEALAVGP